MTNKNIDLTFRNEFEKIVNDNEIVLRAAFQKVLNMPSDDVRNILWLLTYGTRTSIFISLSKLGLTPKHISSENFSTLRDELLFQYENLHPDFLSVDVPYDCLETFTELINYAGYITAYEVLHHCEKKIISYDEQTLLRILCRLQDERKVNDISFGLRMLGFTSDEADYLKPYHKHIFVLLMNLKLSEDSQSIPLLS